VGFQTYGGLIIDASGNLYGMTIFVRRLEQQVRYGVRVDAQSGRGLDREVLHSSDNKNADGTDPQAGVFIDGSGNLNGTIQVGRRL
jgi:hypothetical protein